MIKALLRTILINGVAVYLAARYISGFHIPFQIQQFGLLTLILSFIHFFIRPLLDMFLGAINLLTFGVLSLVIDVAILYAVSLLFPQIAFSRWLFPGFSYSGFTVPAYNLPPLGTLAATTIFIGLIRSSLLYLSS